VRSLTRPLYVISFAPLAQSFHRAQREVRSLTKAISDGHAAIASFHRAQRECGH